MKFARWILILALASCTSEPRSNAPSQRSADEATANTTPNARAPASLSASSNSTAASPSSGLALTIDLSRERALIDEANAALKTSDLATARAKAAEAVTALLARPQADQDAAWLELLDSAGVSAWKAQDARTANLAWQRVVDIRSRTLSEDHPDLQMARQNLAGTLYLLGDLSEARTLLEQALEVNSRTLPKDHRDLQKARLNLAATMYALGDLPEARALNEKVLEVYARTLPDDHPDLQTARINLAGTVVALGDFSGARALLEKVLEVFSRTLSDDHPALQVARQNLAIVIKALGDLPGARALEEKVLEVRSRTLPEDHPDLQKTRLNLAVTMQELGDLSEARALEEQALEVNSRTLPEDHPDLQKARLNLAATLHRLGDLPGACALEEKVLEVCARTLPDDHPTLQAARQTLAVTITLQAARVRRARTGEGEGQEESEGLRKRCSDLIAALCRAEVRASRQAILTSSSREAEERCASLAEKLDVSLSFANGYGVFEPLRELEPEAFTLCEATRGAAIASARLVRKAESAPKYAELRDALRRASDELAALAQKGTTSEEFDRARTKRDDAERELVAMARELSGSKLGGVEFDVDSLSAQIPEHEALVGFRRYKKWKAEGASELDSTGEPAIQEASTDNLCAFVLRRSSENAGARVLHANVVRVELAPIDAIEHAVHEWRDAIGAAQGRGIGVSESPAASDLGARGGALRKLVFDPLLPALQGADHVVVALDDVLHLVPFDALPADEKGDALVGDRCWIETRATLWEVVEHRAKLEGSGGLLGVGGVSYDGDGDESKPVAVASVAARSVESAGILRGGAWADGFNALPSTKDEVEGIARSFEEVFGATADRHVLERSEASKEKLLELAPRARFVHIATHGWFAPESIKSWSDPEPIDKKSGLGLRMSGEEQVRGMSPMLLCGLALAGANLPENAVGRVPGLVTAEELSTLDLSNCELAVLSACDTNVGERRAGQGVASLQKALQMAGARSVITSLWKVPDEATKELMLDFYRRLWVEKKPKHQALWEAKMKLRARKDERGKPVYSTRDWAAWVLTGDPK